ncbi:hypothetical protein EI427_12960 [Flammeovirga pectinis]|uniref:Uncharacterized protein n=1 Tax=Flammeovirga pectinis TaxID=2494373 RepID=A0A3S9P4H7_9BACT|nr:hypothetical protein [Flammeovirga pectinis]AZQ63115.1 hypothetical protein EI427_12960 [Flammeovirga pectinis]
MQGFKPIYETNKLTSLQNEVSKNNRIISVLDSVIDAEEITVIEIKNEKISATISDTQNKLSLDAETNVTSLFKVIEVEGLKTRALAIVEVFSELFSFGDTQGWSYNDYGLKTV